MKSFSDAAEKRGSTSRAAELILRPACGRVLEKIDLADQHHVVGKEVFALLARMLRRADTGEFFEVANQVRLIVIPAGHRELCPIGRIRL